MSQAETQIPRPAQIDARRAWLYPVIVWAAQFISVFTTTVLRDPAIIFVMSICLAIIQLLFLFRGVFYGIRALRQRSHDEAWVILPASIGLIISFGTLALIAFAVLVFIILGFSH